MNDATFNQRVADTLLTIENAVEHCGADIDFETTQGILTLAFADGSRIIINAQSALRQLWVAARSGGYHYAWDEASGRWQNDKTGAALFPELSQFVSEQAGVPVSLG